MDERQVFKKHLELVKTESLLPIKVSEFYNKKVENEVKHIGIGGPLYRSVYPVSEIFDVYAGEKNRDFADEQAYTIDNFIIKRYPTEVLVLITERCFSHCQYCFRSLNITTIKKDNPMDKIEVLYDYLIKNPQIKEVIFSGGDPMVLKLEEWKAILKKFSKWDIRIHTRSIVYDPTVFSEDIIKLFSKYNVRLVFHINHPYEICKTVKDKINLLRNYKIRMYAQFPLLRGINDNIEVLKKLLYMLDELSIRTLSFFIVDAIKYSSAYRISFDRIEKILNELNWTTPSWVNSTRLIMHTSIGKVRREDIVCRKRNVIIFHRDDKKVKYIDFPKKLDIPGDIKKLLWKDYILNQ